MKHMKHRYLVIAAIALIMTSTASASEFPSSSVPPNQENELTAEDSLNIIKMPEGKYYVFCNICPLEASDGFLRLRIMDTIDFIDQDIPKSDWVRAYAIKNYCYKSIHKRSLATFDGGYFVIKNRFDDYLAIRSDRKITSFVFHDIQKNSERQALFAGGLAAGLLLMASIIMGVIIFFIKALWKKVLIFLTFPLLLFAFLVVLIIATKEVIIYALGIYLAGSILMPSILTIASRKKNKKR